MTDEDKRTVRRRTLAHAFVADALVDFDDPEIIERLRDLLKKELERLDSMQRRRVKYPEEGRARRALVGGGGHTMALALCKTIDIRRKEERAYRIAHAHGRHEDGWM